MHKQNANDWKIKAFSWLHAKHFTAGISAEACSVQNLVAKENVSF